MINVSYNNWKITLASLQAQQFDDNCIEVQFNGEFPTGVTWKMNFKYGKNFDVIDLENVDDEDEQLSVILDGDYLSYSGQYSLQLVGTWTSSGVECTRHTNKLDFIISPSLDGAIEWTPLPSVIETELNLVAADIAPVYSTSTSYSAGAVVIYKRQLYICTSATSGTFDSTKWSAIDAYTNLNTKINAKQDTLTDSDTDIHDAVTKKHEHSNKSILDTITSALISTWNTVTGKYTKPDSGIPKSDLASDVQTSLGKADTALQSHQSLSAYRTAAEQNVIDAEKVNTTDYAPDTKTSTMTQAVGKDSSGKLWTAPSSGGTSDFDELSNRPSYNGSVMTHSTDIPEVKTSEWDSKAAGNHNHDSRYYTETETDTLLSAKESTANKVTSMSSESTDTEYPSAKAVYDAIPDEAQDIYFDNNIKGLLNVTDVQSAIDELSEDVDSHSSQIAKLTWRTIIDYTFPEGNTLYGKQFEADDSGKAFVLSKAEVYIVAPLDTEKTSFTQGYVNIKSTYVNNYSTNYGNVALRGTTSHSMISQVLITTSDDFMTFADIVSGTWNEVAKQTNITRNYGSIATLHKQIEGFRLFTNANVPFSSGTRILIRGLDK